MPPPQSFRDPTKTAASPFHCEKGVRKREREVFLLSRSFRKGNGLKLTDLKEGERDKEQQNLHCVGNCAFPFRPSEEPPFSLLSSRSVWLIEECRTEGIRPGGEETEKTRGERQSTEESANLPRGSDETTTPRGNNVTMVSSLSSSIYFGGLESTPTSRSMPEIGLEGAAR